MKSINPGKQRKKLYNAPQHLKRKWIASHLEENLLLKYDKRSIPVIKGDTVKVMRGSFKGHEDKIAGVNVKKRTLEIEGITMSKADGNKIAKPIHHSNVLITKLNLTDKWRRKKLEKGLTEEAKKEIEKEAEMQLKQAEEEKKRLEEEAKALKDAEEAEESVEEKDLEPEEKEKLKTTTKTETEKKKEMKKQPVKKSTVKKSEDKKPQTKKKTPSKTVKEKEEK